MMLSSQTMGLCTSSFCTSTNKDRVGTPETFASDETNIPPEEERLFLIREISRYWIDLVRRRPNTPMFGSATPGFGVNDSITW